MKLRHLKRALSVCTVMALVLSALTLAGCSAASGSKPTVTPAVVSPPAIGESGILKVGVDSTHAPFAGSSKGQLVGIDIDVASAIADQLGLHIQVVDIAGQSADTLLNDGTIDIVMDVEQTGGATIKGTQVGPYAESGPALFTIVKSDQIPSIDLKSLNGTKIAAQKDSLSAWSVDELIGKGTADPKANLAEAFAAVENGASTYAAADAIVGSYLAVDYKDVSAAKLLGTPVGVYIGVASTNAALPDPLTNALRSIRDSGALKTILSKWLGPVSAGVVVGDAAITSQTVGNSATPNLTPGEVDTGVDLPDPTNAGSA